MKNHESRPGTMKDHESRSGTMKNQPGTMKTNLEPWKIMKNQPGTMKNQPGTMKNHENRPETMKNQPLIQKTPRDEHGAPTDLLCCKWESAHGVVQLKVIIFRGLRGVTTDLHDTAWESDHFSWLTYTGSQLTFMTQNEKAIIFCDLLTRGHNWPSWHSMRKWSFFVTYLHGVTTDLLDV